MKFVEAPLGGVIVVEPDVHGDSRGFFLESYHRDRFAENGIPDEFVQDNHSLSTRGALRGLHYQAAPMAQAKLVRVIRGSIWDVVVDLRESSPTFGCWFGEDLSERNRKMIYVPEGFAHGYLSLEDSTEVLYKASNFYSPAHERGIRWDDRTLAIDWPQSAAPFVVSDKDRSHPALDAVFPNRIGR